MAEPVQTPTADLAAIERDPWTWCTTLYPRTYAARWASYHGEFWDWVWSIPPSLSFTPETQPTITHYVPPPPPYAAIWARGWAKSTNGEAAVCALAARDRRRYCLYVSGTQDQANSHVQDIGIRFEAEKTGEYYPDIAERAVNLYGAARGWRRNRLWTKRGFIVDALGLDVAVRGAKLGDDRPDLIVLDDVDSLNDSAESIEKKIEVLTKSILPAGSPDCVVLVLQNLIHGHGIVAQLADGRADFLADVVISGPYPAIADLVTEGAGKQARILSGTPTWPVRDLDVCQAQIRRMGLNAFLSECQHKVQLAGQPRFDLDKLDIIRRLYQRDPLDPALLPPKFRVIEGLRVYCLPEAGVSYVVYTDGAQGFGRDYTSTHVANAVTGEQCAVLEDNDRNPTTHATIGAALAEWYGDAFVGFERAHAESIGFAYGSAGIPEERLYHHQQIPTEHQRRMGLEPERRMGYPMTRQTKATLIANLAEGIDGLAVIHDKRTLDQLGGFVVTPNLELQAAAGGHDDNVIGYAGTRWLMLQPEAKRRNQGLVPAGPVSSSYGWG